MATNDVFSLHNRGGIDLLDYVGAPAFGLAAVVISGIGTFSLWGYSMSETLWSSSSASISIAFIVATVLLAAAWATNRAGDGWDDLDEVESAAVGGGVIILLGIAFVPMIQDLILGSKATGTIAFLLLEGAYTVIAWY